MSLTEAIRIELRSQGTQVIAVHVGYMDTDMTAPINDAKVNPRDVAASILDGIQNDREEVLADQTSHSVKALLASNRQAFYQDLSKN